MKIFDRYIILNFLKNYLLSFVVLVGLYIALDMVFHFDELVRSVTAPPIGNEKDVPAILPILSLLGNIGEFYLYQPFVFFVHLSGIIPVVAAAFTLMRMTRFNELTAMLAAGVPMLRIAAPVIAVGVGLSVLLVVDQELIIPRITHKLVREHDEIGQVRGRSFRITMMEDGQGARLSAARYTPPDFDRDGKLLPATMERVDILEFDDQHRPVAHIQAPSATYEKHRWILSGGTRQTGLRPQDAVANTPLRQWASDIGPEEIILYRRAGYVDLLSTSQINSLLQHPRNYGTVPLLRVKYWRFVQPLANIVLLMLAIPCVLTREPGSIKMAATRTVLLTGACLGSMFIAHQLAASPPTPELAIYWPAIILWLPIFLFAPLAVWQLDRVKT